MDEILISARTAGTQIQPAVAGIGSGSLGQFIVVWADRAEGSILGRRYARDGDPIGSEIRVAVATSPNAELIRPAVSSRGSGFVVAWIERALNPPGPQPHVHVQSYSQEGQPIGGPIQVSATDVDTGHTPGIALLAGGGFVVTWVNLGGQNRILARRFNSDGLASGDVFTVNTTEGFHERPMVTHLAAGAGIGNFAVGWTTDPASIGAGALRLRLFDFQGNPASGELAPNLFGGETDIVLLPDGGFVVARISNGDLDDIGVRKSIVEVNIFEGNGVSGIEFGASAGGHVNCSWPALASFPDGRFVTAWVQKRSDTFQTNPVVNATVMSRDGHVSEIVQISTATATQRSSLCAAALFGMDTGDHVFIVWADDSGSGGDAANLDIRGRILEVSSAGGLS